MWHEARKQEKKIRGMLVDYRKRADRRKEFYEKIKADPNQFLQVHGRKCKIHYEVTDMTDDMHMMPWQGQKDNLIDRFDVRAHLDYIPPPKKEDLQEEKITEQERQVNYEAYRVLAQNEFLGINEPEFLRQVQTEEQFGSVEKGGGVDSDKKKKNSQANAAIGYTYEDSTATSSSSVPFSQQILSIETSTASSSRFEEFAKDYSDESDIDMDVQVDVKKIGTTQAHELNNFGKKYGMISNDLFSYLTRDEEEKQSMKAMKEQEADKILGGGRKSRRERRSQREKRILGKPLTFSPPSYAAKEEKLPENEEESDKSSRESKSPSIEKITYITSFGGEEELQPHSKISIPFKKTMPKNLVNLRRNETFADKVRENSDKLRHLNDTEKRKDSRRSRSSSRHRGRSRSASRRRRYRSRSRSYSRRRYSSRSRSRSRRRRYSSRSYSRSSRSVSRERYSSRRKSSSYRKRSSYKSRSRDRRRSSSRERSRNRRKYSSSSSSSSTSSTSSSSSHRSSTRSPEKKSVKEKSISREKSKSPIREKPVILSPKTVGTSDNQPPPPPAVVKRYYGRRKDEESSSSLSVDSDDNDHDHDRRTGSNESSANDVQKVRSADIKIGLSKSTTTVGPPTIMINPREKLKKKMQILLNKQYKADKKAETEKIERQMQQQQERDEEMRELAIKLRKRQRELRHKYGEENKDSNTNSESDENDSKRHERKSSTSSSSSSSNNDSKKGRSRSNSSSRRRKRFKTSISRSPVRYGARRSRSKSSGRNYRRRYSRSRSRDYRR